MSFLRKHSRNVEIFLDNSGGVNIKMAPMSNVAKWGGGDGERRRRRKSEREGGQRREESERKKTQESSTLKMKLLYAV
jgi:hypothetical protein